MSQSVRERRRKNSLRAASAHSAGQASTGAPASELEFRCAVPTCARLSLRESRLPLTPSSSDCPSVSGTRHFTYFLLLEPASPCP